MHRALKIEFWILWVYLPWASHLEGRQERMQQWRSPQGVFRVIFSMQKSRTSGVGGAWYLPAPWDAGTLCEHVRRSWFLSAQKVLTGYWGRIVFQNSFNVTNEVFFGCQNAYNGMKQALVLLSHFTSNLDGLLLFFLIKLCFETVIF